MKNKREGTSENYAKKEGVAHSELTVPNDAPEWARALAVRRARCEEGVRGPVEPCRAR